MRPDEDRVRDVLKAAMAIADRLAAHTLETLKKDSDAIKATFYDVIVLGEAMRGLVAKKDGSEERIGEDSEIVKANPDIPWIDWIGMRDVVTHQYFRTEATIVWRDYETGELKKLIECCEAWLARTAAG